VPVAKHQPESTDFLVIRNGDRYYIREMDSVYVAGQSHPFLRVPAPNSKEHTNYIRRHCLSYICNRLKNGGQLQTHEVLDEFPETSEAIIRRQLKDCAQFQREGGEGGHWTLKDGFEMPKEFSDINDTPEDSCMWVALPTMGNRRSLELGGRVSWGADARPCRFESLREGNERLRNMGIARLTTLEGHYSTAVQEIMKDRNLDSVIRSGAPCVQETLRLAPWNLSKDFVQAAEQRQPLPLHSLVASSTARKTAQRYDPSVKQQDPKVGCGTACMACVGAGLRAGVWPLNRSGSPGQDKKVQTDYQRRKQLCFNEMLETLRAKERASSSDEVSASVACRVLGMPRQNIELGHVSCVPPLRQRDCCVGCRKEMRSLMSCWTEGLALLLLANA